ncbi:hypothetical protein GGS24DRAFT_490168 [Hypoxylon argillaceum]|nr:hypothetical protein GGS24DRAFT_490168 [Hypoxylon argillaceum]
MSFGFSVSDFLAGIALIKKVYKDFAGAPDQIQQISKELTCLENAAHDTQSIINNYQEVLGPKKLSTKGRAIRVWKRLHLEPDDTRELRDRITLCVAFIDNFFNRLEKDKEQKQEVLDWLSSIDFSTQKSDFLRRRQEGTGQWLLNSKEYQHWLQTKKEVLFCPGIPGAGKTILTSIVVDDLLVRHGDDESVGICYIFLNFRHHGSQKLDDLIASLLKQLAWTQSVLSGNVKLLYDRHKKRHTRPSFDELCQALYSVIAEYSRIFFVIDALDECQTQDNCRSKFISEILKLWSEHEANVLTSSRLLPEITSRFDTAVLKEIRASDEDMGRYLDGNLSCLPGFVARDLTLQTETKEKILQSVDGMFLLAQLHFDSLRGKPSPKAIRTALGKLAKGSGAYDVAYDDAMTRIKGQLPDQEKLALDTLIWITSAERPLTTVELRHALGVELNETKFDESNLPDLEDMVSNCCGLVTLDEQSNVIRLVHYTTQEYFERSGARWFPKAQSQIAKTCVTYLSFDAFDSGICKSDSQLEDRLSSYPLYDYASCYWGSHACLVSDCQFYFTFLQNDCKVGACGRALFYKNRGLGDRSQKVPRQINGLHLAAFFGLHKVIASLVESCDVNAIDSRGNPPIAYAIRERHKAVAQLLLEKGSMVDISVNGIPLLSYSIRFGPKNATQAILDRGANTESKDNEGKTPLFWASNNTATVQLLLNRGANIESKDNGGRTPLFLAVHNYDNMATVQLLLDRGANTKSKDSYGQTALSHALRLNNKDIVKLLRENGAVE